MPQFDIISNYLILIIFFFTFFIAYLGMYIIVNSLLKFTKIIDIVSIHFGFINNYEHMSLKILDVQKNWQLFIFFKI